MSRSLRFSSIVFASALALVARPGFAGGPTSAHHGRSTEGVFWFVHLSDLHIGASILEGPNAPAHLQLALGEVVTTIAPKFVAVTGDLVDASMGIIPTAGQSQGEWDMYKNIVAQAGMTPTLFYDLPGNHDGYGDIGLTHYLANSLQGQTNHALSVFWQVQTPVGRYDFYGLDSAGNGSGPFLEQPHFRDEQVAALFSGLAQNADAELSFVLAHHRLTEPDNGAQVIDVMRNAGGGYYIHGHVHEYSEYTEGQATIVVNEVNSLGKADGQNIAVGAVDNNAFVYRATDVSALWPFVIITAPVAEKIRGGSELHPYAYGVCKDRTDNPFRALVFAPTPPSQVEVEVTGLSAVPMALVPGSTSLWQAEIDTSSLSAGTVDVKVTATAGGITRTDTIGAKFMDGPCDVLPGGAGGSGGAGGAGGGGGAASGGAGGASSGGAGGASSRGAGGTSTGAGGDGGTGPDAISAAAGCGCEVAGGAGSSGVVWAALLGLGLLGRPRRRR